MSQLAQRLLKIMQTAEGKNSFSKTEFIEYDISENDAESALKELEKNGHIFVYRKYLNGTPVYKLS